MLRIKSLKKNVCHFSITQILRDVTIYSCLTLIEYLLKLLLDTGSPFSSVTTNSTSHFKLDLSFTSSFMKDLVDYLVTKF